MLLLSSCRRGRRPTSRRHQGPRCRRRGQPPPSAGSRRLDPLGSQPPPREHGAPLARPRRRLRLLWVGRRCRPKLSRAIDVLDVRHLRRVGRPFAGHQHPGVAAGALLVPGTRRRGSVQSCEGRGSDRPRGGRGARRSASCEKSFSSGSCPNTIPPCGWKRRRAEASKERKSSKCTFGCARTARTRATRSFSPPPIKPSFAIVTTRSASRRSSLACQRQKIEGKKEITYSHESREITFCTVVSMRSCSIS